MSDWKLIIKKFRTDLRGGTFVYKTHRCRRGRTWGKWKTVERAEFRMEGGTCTAYAVKA